MSDLIDISVPLEAGMPVWPGSVGFSLTRTLSLEAGDEANVSRLDCDVHTGTHIDAPRHFVPQGATVEQLALDVFVGPADVVHVPEAEVITPAVFEALSAPIHTERLLLRTRNSARWQTGATAFAPDYVALTAEAAQWVVAQGIRLIGVDYLSVQRYGDDPLTHQILLEAGVVIVEGLNLSHVEPGVYELICLPLRLVGAEGAPARAVLRRLKTT